MQHIVALAVGVVYHPANRRNNSHLPVTVDCRLAHSNAQANNMGDTPKITLYTSWFCPFAQRTWMTLVHKNIKFNHKEVDPYSKPPELVAVNPHSLVPALDDDGHNVYESLITMEYLEDAYPQEPILPKSATGKATARIWADYCHKKLVPVFYRMLQRQEECDREAARKEMLEHIRVLSKTMTELSNGPFFMGEEFGFVDITLSPWIERLYILKHFRGFEVPGSVNDVDSEFHRFHKWWQAVRSVRAFQATLCNRDELLQTYQRYADNSAQSKVAKAIRNGGPMP